MSATSQTAHDGLERKHRTRSKIKAITEVIGWGGAMLVFLAFAFVSYGMIEPQRYLFQLLNLFGALGLTINALAHRAYPLAVLNTVWTLVALASLFFLWLA